MTRGHLKQIAAELVACAIDDILTGGAEGLDHALPSVQHLVGLTGDDMETLADILGRHKTALQKEAGPLADQPHRLFRQKLGEHR